MKEETSLAKKGDNGCKMTLSYIMAPQPNARVLPPVPEEKETVIGLTYPSENEDEDEEMPLVQNNIPHASSFRSESITSNLINVPSIPNDTSFYPLHRKLPPPKK